MSTVNALFKLIWIFRSIKISDESQGKGFCKPEINERQDWGNQTIILKTSQQSELTIFVSISESKPHPYLFFNNDGHSLSFFGFHLDKSLRILNEKTGEVLVKNILNDYLYRGLINNGVKFNQDLDRKSRLEKLNGNSNNLKKVV